MADPDLEQEPDDELPGEEPEDEPEGDPSDEPEEEPEGDPDGGDDPDPEPDPEPAPRQSKAQERIRRQQAELVRNRTETAALKARLDQLTNSTNAAQQAENQRRQAELLAGMEPDERARAIADARFNQLQQQVQRQSWELQENNDRATWQTRVTTDAVAKRYADRVDARLSEMRANGQTAPRESVYFYLLGEDIAKKGPKAIASQRAAASGRARNAAGTLQRSRPDASRQSGRLDPESLEAIEARLSKAVF